VFGAEDPIGQKILVWRDEQIPREIVGVAGDLKSKDLAASAGAEMFVPIAQSPVDDMTFVARTDAAPGLSAAAIKAALQSLDATQAAYDVKTFDTIMAEALAQQRFSVALFGAFAALALALAAVGLYGVMSQVVAGRAHEMGVRLALGARPAEVRGLVVKQGMWLLAIGMAVGIPAALAGSQLLGKLLYGVRPADPITFAGMSFVIGLVIWISAYVPARRATRVDPAIVLRGD
jgi:putative ABC transport system permease protein